MSLGDLKKAKKSEKFYKKRALKWNSNFFDSELPYETRTSFFIAFSVIGTQNWSIFRVKFNRKYFNSEKNYTKSEQISSVHTKVQSSITPRKKTKIKKFFLILNSTLNQLFNDTTHISLRRIYRSAKID